MLEEVKGYVRFYDDHLPVTWSRETARYVYNVRTLRSVEDRWEVNTRVFDEKIDKNEIIFFDATKK